MNTYEHTAPHFSVIIPAYNVEPWIAACLDSLLAQTDESWEAIIVDDGSVDGTARICARYLDDPRFTLLQQENAGLSVTRNRALPHARGQLTYFLDADDYLEPSGFEVLWSYAAEFKADIVLFGANVFCNGAGLEEIAAREAEYFDRAIDQPVHGSGRELLLSLLRRQRFCAPMGAVVYRTQLLRDFGLQFIPGVIHEDEAFMVESLMTDAPAVIVPDRLYGRRIRPRSIMTTERPDVARRLLGNFLTAARLYSMAEKDPSPAMRDALDEKADWHIHNVRAALRQLEEQGEYLRIPSDVEMSDDERAMLRMACRFVERSNQADAESARRYDALSSQLAAAEQARIQTERELVDVRASKTFRIGLVITALPRAIRHLLGI